MSGRLDPAVAAARRAVAKTLADLDPGSCLVVAVSGGADSLALAAATRFVADKNAWRLSAVVVDHGLQDSSAAVALRAVECVRGLGIEARVERVEVGSKGGLEAAARAARYEAFDRVEADAILLAHTRDDQAETVLLGLGRGSGPRSIAGMRAATGRYRRPFLTLTRADTEAVCRAEGLEWWVDPHNGDARFRRVRVRHEVLPLLEDVLGGGVGDALARTAEQVQADTDYLDAVAEAALGTGSPPGCAHLATLHSAVRKRVVRLLALRAGARDLAAEHIEALDRLVVDWRGQGGVDLPGHVVARRVGDSLRFADRRVAG